MTADKLREACELLEECSELLDGYADADCTGDPPSFKPNKAMALRQEILEFLTRPTTESDWSKVVRLIEKGQLLEARHVAICAFKAERGIP